MSRVGQKFSEDIKNMIIQYSKDGYSTVEITRLLLAKHEFKTTRQSDRRLISKFAETGTCKRRPTTDPRRKILDVHLDFIQLCMAKNPESTSAMLRLELFKSFKVNVTTEYISMLRKKMGWTPSGTAKYCQLISHK